MMLYLVPLIILCSYSRGHYTRFDETFAPYDNDDATKYVDPPILDTSYLRQGDNQNFIMRLSSSLRKTKKLFSKRQSNFNPWGGKRSRTENAKMNSLTYKPTCTMLSNDNSDPRFPRINVEETYPKAIESNTDFFDRGLPYNYYKAGWMRNKHRKRAFSSWDDKKRTMMLMSHEARGSRGPWILDKMNEKRTFNSWGGKKRSLVNLPLKYGDVQRPNVKSDMQNYGNLDSDIEKRSFNSWGGKKRNDVNLPFKYGDVRGNYGVHDSDIEKRTFNSWGGKKRNDVNLPWKYGYVDETNVRPGVQNSLVSEKKAGKRTFNSWGGKKRVYLSKSYEHERDRIGY